MKAKFTENDYCMPVKNTKIMGVYRNRNTGRRERYGFETDLDSYIRIYHDDVDSGSDLILPDGMAKEIIKKIKKIIKP